MGFTVSPKVPSSSNILQFYDLFMADLHSEEVDLSRN